MRKLIFGEGLLEPTLDGSKRITIRRYRREVHHFNAGDIVLGEFKDGVTLLLRITRDTEVFRFDSIPEDCVTADGFDDRLALFEGLKKYYPDLQSYDLVGVIYFEAETDGDAFLLVQSINP